MSQALTVFRQDHPEKELLVIAPCANDALLFDRSFLSYQDRVHLLRAGYLSVVTLVHEAYESLQAQFARHGIVLERTGFENRATSRLSLLDQIVAASAPLQRPLAGVALGLDASRTALHQAK